MKWKGRRESKNVEDRRGQGGGFRFPFPGGKGGGGGLRFPMPGGRGGRRNGGMGLLGMLLMVGVMIFFPNLARILFGGSGGLPFPLPGGGGGGGIQLPRQMTPGGGAGGGSISKAKQNEMAKFTSVVLAETEDVWNKIFSDRGRRYKEPKLQIFSNYTNTACGPGMQMMGPFYCPLDSKVYVDLSFYNELKTKFGVSGDFAQAYVIAHEVGHHVQNLLGIAKKVQDAKRRTSKRQANAIQVRMELQADCFAGVWARQTQDTKKILDPGDIDEALNAASAIGDDKIQRRTQGRVVPDAFTHGSAAQRVRWFKNGFQSGRMQACDTFNASRL